MSLPFVVSLGSVLAPLAATVQGFAILVSLRWPTYIDRDARRKYLEQAALPMVQEVVTLLEPGVHVLVIPDADSARQVYRALAALDDLAGEEIADILVAVDAKGLSFSA